MTVSLLEATHYNVDIDLVVHLIKWVDLEPNLTQPELVGLN